MAVYLSDKNPKLESDMVSVFSRFNSYNFAADQRFVDGLKTLKKSDSRDETELLNMKLFYYNRFVEPINSSSYKQWSSSSHHVAGPGFIVEQLDQRTLSHSDPDTSGSNITDTCTHKETKQLSFAEVMRLVQEGKEVPGVAKLDIQPSNQSPSPSQMERPLKPWET